jgi:hypothetical protein
MTNADMHLDVIEDFYERVYKTKSTVGKSNR